ncbi:MAG: S-ribosylhomocysteine lyase [Candidatus Fimivicinus sp.]|nr:S-ribosylhomocysteine lyase [Oscillospiraceae bacterium]MDY5591582.1 S-ribosylhomocysteine lyase [Candidatus Fimivicinus sp.]
MEKILSFQIDHTKLPCGMYLSRVDGDIDTYDLRTRRPNREPVMANGAMHTVEHLFATFVRNSADADQVVYFGPMGCRTGFYFLTRGMDRQRAIELTKSAFAFIAAYEGEIPGATERECGNWRDHNLESAKKEAQKMVKILESWTVAQLKYPE